MNYKDNEYESSGFDPVNLVKQDSIHDKRKDKPSSKPENAKVS